MTPRTTLAIAVAVGAAALSGCAHRVPSALQQAQTAYTQVAAQPDVAKNAPVKLHEAEQQLRDAQRQWDDDHDTREAEHDAYLVRQRLAIAEAAAEQKKYEDQVRAAGQAPSNVLLQARERELRDLRARQTQRGLEVTLGDVLFETDKATLKPGAALTLDKLVDVLRQDPSEKVVIEGHTDSRGSAEYNRQLSDERANAVRDYLVAHGIAADRIAANGYGEAYPVASNDTAAGRQQNRRVEVVIMNRGGSATSGARPLSGEPYGGLGR
jgi:outer membrane protein OmpA-like peptidoglycan-associated protein